MKKLTLLVISLSLCLSGCKNYAEVENLTIVTAVGVDKVEDMLEVSIEVVKFTKDSQKVSIVVASGQTYHEAITNAIKITGNELYFSHAQVLILSDEIANEGVYSFMDTIYRNSDLRLDMSILIAKDNSAYEILSAKSLIDDISGLQIKTIIDSNDLVSEVPSMPVYEFIDDVTSEGICGKLPVVKLTDGKDAEIREISGVALFQDDYIYGYLDKKQTKTIGVLKNKAETGKIINQYVENAPTYNLEKAKTTIKVEIVDKKPKFTFDVKMDLKLIEQQTRQKSILSENQKAMEEEITLAVKKDIDDLIKVQIANSGADFLGLGDLIYRKDPDFWKEIRDDFESYIKNLDYTLNVECKIVSSGLVSTALTVKD